VTRAKGRKVKEATNQYILNWIDENILSIASVQPIVEKTGFSRRTIEYWFKQRYRLSPGEYLLVRRISYAASLLRMTSLPVIDISNMFQYHSSQGFARAFKKVTGKTPSEYRNAPSWDFSRYQPSLTLESMGVPEVSFCELNESFRYSHRVTDYDHIFNPNIKDVTKRIRKLLIENKGSVEMIAISGRRPEAINKSMGHFAEVTIDYIPSSGAGENMRNHTLGGKYAKMSFDGDWETYGKKNKMLYIWTMAKHRLSVRDEPHLMQFRQFSENKVSYDIYIPII